MSVKVFFPKIPDNEEEFKRFIMRFAEGRCRIAKNKDGSKFCILSIKFDENIRCAHDLISLVSGQIVNEVTLKPKIHVDTQTMRVLDNFRFPDSDGVEDMVTTTHVEGVNYYVQLMSEAEEKLYVTSKLKELYIDFTENKSMGLNISKIEVGNIYATVYQDEGTFHRIRVMEKLNNTLKVMFIDYGNIDVIESVKIININEDLANKLPLAHCCQIEAVEIVDMDKHSLIILEIINRPFKARVVWKFCDIYQVNRVVAIDFINFTTISYREYLIGQAIARLEISHPLAISPSNHKDSPCKQNKIIEMRDRTKSAIMTHYESTDEFYILFNDPDTDKTLASINSLIYKLPEEYDSSKTEYNETDLYLCKYSEDGNLYRCRITKMDVYTNQKGVMVQYVDFGNSEWKSDKTTLKHLSSNWCAEAAELNGLKSCSIKCGFDEELSYILQSCSVTNKYFVDTFIVPELQINITYTMSNNEASVSNIEFGDDKDLLTEFDRSIDVGNSERYVLTCTDSLDHLWFVLIKSFDKGRQQKLEAVRKLCTSNDVNYDSVDCPVVNEVYLVITDTDKRLRAKYLGCEKRGMKLYFRDIDTGFIELIKYDLVFHLPTKLVDIGGFGKAFRLKVKNAIKSDMELMRQIKRIIGKNEVALRLQDDDETIVDVIIKGRSLIKYLVKQGLAERDSQLPDLLEESLKDLPQCVNNNNISSCPKVQQGDNNDSYEVDFSLPSIEDMTQIPASIVKDNAKVRFLRMLFCVSSLDNESQFLTELNMLKSLSLDSNELIELSRSVQQLSIDFETITEQFLAKISHAKVKRTDLNDLMDKRTELCHSISSLHDRVSCEIQKSSLDSEIETLSSKLQGLTIFLLNVKTILAEETQQIDTMTTTSPCSTIHIANFEELCCKLKDLVDSKYFKSIQNQSKNYINVTDISMRELRNIINLMCSEYNLSDSFDEIKQSAPLIDTTYKLQAAIANELKLYVCSGGIGNNVNGSFDIDGDEKGDKIGESCPTISNKSLINLISACHICLAQYNTDIQTIIKRSRQLNELNKVAQQIITMDDTNVAIIQTIESNNKLIRGCRSALRRANTDLEDAEDEEDIEKIEEYKENIKNLKMRLHKALDEVGRSVFHCEKGENINWVMKMKPELQIVNQTLLIDRTNIPVFLWDIKYFDLTPCYPVASCLSVSANYRYYNSHFMRPDNIVKILQLKIPNPDTTRPILTNINRIQSLSYKTNSLVSILPISFSFLSTSCPQFHYIMNPNFHYIVDDETMIFGDDKNNELRHVIMLLRDSLDVAINLWHDGYIYTANDFNDGFYINCLNKYCLPLPINAIFTREIVLKEQWDSINVFSNHMYSFFTKTSVKCSKLIEDTNNPRLLATVKTLPTCKHIDDLETLMKEFDVCLEVIDDTELQENIEEILIKNDDYDENEKDNVNNKSSVNSGNEDGGESSISIEQLVDDDQNFREKMNGSSADEETTNLDSSFEKKQINSIVLEEELDLE